MRYDDYAQFEFAKNLRFLVSKIDILEKKFLKARNINVSQRELEYIALIGDNQNMSFTQLIKRESISKSTFSNQVKLLESKGLVTPQMLGGSKKVKTLKLTDQGHKIFAHYQEIRVHFFEKYVKPHFSSDELAHINFSVEKLFSLFSTLKHDLHEV